VTTTGAFFRNPQKTATHPAGATIFDAGDEAEAMYGVMSGEVELRRGDTVVRRLGVDDVFGEMALIDRSERSLTAVAATDCQLAVVDRRHFLFLVHETPTFALHVMSASSSRASAPPPRQPSRSTGQPALEAAALMRRSGLTATGHPQRCRTGMSEPESAYAVASRRSTQPSSCSRRSSLPLP
jgi:CRP/FNR family transcriptional regulator, cyclic AMP receptor protein